MTKTVFAPDRRPIKHPISPSRIKIGPLMRRALLEEMTYLAVAIELAPPHERGALQRQFDAVLEFLGGGDEDN